MTSAGLCLFCFSSYCDHRYPHSFPTRRSSDLLDVLVAMDEGLFTAEGLDLQMASRESRDIRSTTEGDRKSTRLNSSHTVISYAVFCLKKKNREHSAQGGEGKSQRLSEILRKPH